MALYDDFRIIHRPKRSTLNSSSWFLVDKPADSTAGRISIGDIITYLEANLTQFSIDHATEDLDKFVVFEGCTEGFQYRTGLELWSDITHDLFTEGSVLFADSDGRPSEDNTNLFWAVATGLKVGTILHEATDVDKFLVSNAGLIKYRTGAELLSDIGGGGVPGSGTLNYLPKWTPDGTTLGDSAFQDDGATTSLNAILDATKKLLIETSTTDAGLYVSNTYGAGSTGQAAISGISSGGGIGDIGGDFSGSGSGAANIGVRGIALNAGVNYGGYFDGTTYGIYSASLSNWFAGNLHLQTITNATGDFLTTPTNGGLITQRNATEVLSDIGAASVVHTHVLTGGSITESGLTVGHFLRATGALSFAWDVLTKSDVENVLTGAITTHTHAHSDTTGKLPDDHHNQSHALSGSDHTETGLTTGHVLTATGATTFDWQATSTAADFSGSVDQYYVPYAVTDDVFANSGLISNGTNVSIGGLFNTATQLKLITTSSSINRGISVDLGSGGTADKYGVRIFVNGSTTGINYGMYFNVSDGTAGGYALYTVVGDSYFGDIVILNSVADHGTPIGTSKVLALNASTNVIEYIDYADFSGSGTLPSGTNGDILIYNGGWSTLAKGTDGKILALASGLPSWVTAPTGTGDVTSIGGMSSAYVPYATSSKNIEDSIIQANTATVGIGGINSTQSFKIVSTKAYAQYITNTSTTGSPYGSYISITGASGQNTAMYLNATNAVTNYALYVNAGDTYLQKTYINSIDGYITSSSATKVLVAPTNEVKYRSIGDLVGDLNGVSGTYTSADITIVDGIVTAASNGSSGGSLPAGTTGDILIYNGSWTTLDPSTGSSGDVLTLGASLPSWQNPSLGSGDVTSSGMTSGRVPYNTGTNKNIENSVLQASTTTVGIGTLLSSASLRIASTLTYAQYITSTSTAGSSYGSYVSITGSSGGNTALYLNAQNGVTNVALNINAGSTYLQKTYLSSVASYATSSSATKVLVESNPSSEIKSRTIGNLVGDLGGVSGSFTNSQITVVDGIVTAASDGDVSTIIVYLDESKLENLDTTPIVAIPTPAAGKIIVILNILGVIDWGGISYDSAEIFLYTGGASVWGRIAQNTSLSSASTRDLAQAFQMLDGDSTENGTDKQQYIDSEAVWVRASTSLGTAGNSTMKLYITYRLITL